LAWGFVWARRQRGVGGIEPASADWENLLAKTRFVLDEMAW
jgi:hypothetical protein